MENKKLIMFYDLETNGLLEGSYRNQVPANGEIVQFSAIITDLELNEIERHNIFHNTDIGDYLKKTNGYDYEMKVAIDGLDKEEFYSKVKDIVSNQDIIAYGGHNIRGFDNYWLKQKLNLKSLLYLLKQHDTIIYERNILGADQYGNLTVNGNKTKIKLTLEECCKRNDIDFQSVEAHDGLYDVQKSLELFKKQVELIRKNIIEEKGVTHD